MDRSVLSRSLISSFLVCLLLLVWAGPSAAGMLTPELEAALQIAAPDEIIPVIVIMHDRIDPRIFKDRHKGVRREKIIKALQAKAVRTQGPIMGLLRGQPARARNPRSLWLINGIAVHATPAVIHDLASRPEVALVKLDTIIPLAVEPAAVSAAPVWNIEMLRAQEVWDLGFTGQGVVVASMDTGVDLDHQDLVDRWRGGANSWFDPNGEHDVPYDKSGHGTRVMGLLVGGDAGGTAIGVAPGAQWIAVKIFNDQGDAAESAIHLGFQWLLDPDHNPATNDAPDVVSNSWGYIDDPDKCLENVLFREDIRVFRAAEIAVVFAAGNSGPDVATSMSPANYPENFAVGASNEVAEVAGFSSRGPSACDDDIYPNLLAPGVRVRTADLTLGGLLPDAYVDVSGTSFAAPQAAGAMALLLSAAPGLTVTELETALEQSAWAAGQSVPNDAYGYGVLDVREALSLLPGVNSCQADVDGDGDVDLTDVNVFRVEFGRRDCGTATSCQADLDGDDDVDLTDLNVFRIEFGRRDCPVP